MTVAQPEVISPSPESSEHMLVKNILVLPAYHCSHIACLHTLKGKNKATFVLMVIEQPLLYAGR